MNESSLKKLEYDKIKQMLIGYTVSNSGRELMMKHKPSVNRAQVRAWLLETEEATQLLKTGASVPLSAMEGIEPFIALLGKSKVYTEQELSHLSAWLTAVAQMKRYMDAKRLSAPTISGYANSMYDCPELRKELERCIRYGVLTDQASHDLGDIRKHLAVIEDRIERKLTQTLSKYKAALQDQLVSKRNGHYVLPVKREQRKQVPGTVWDESSSGQTLFVEPVDLAELQVEWQMWKAEEERERMIILSSLSDLAEEQGERLRWNLEAMATFDFIFARAKLSRTYDGISAVLSERPYVKLVGARHPMLASNCVPLYAELGGAWKQLIITGPNTGGKTVTLKTIGLLALMVQSGLLIPAEKGTEFGLFQHILADVGDGQSIEHSLSTFSAHMESLREILQAANGHTLLLLDEMAAGTDPGEGIALAIAVLEELLERGSLVAATTHFNEIKRFAAQQEGCMNARMAFNAETLIPLYRLEIGEAGDSYAFAIARRFGLPETIVRRAEHRASAYTMKELGSGAPQEEKSPEKDKNGQSLPKNYHEGKTTVKPKESKPPSKPFEVGDCVWIHPLKRTGIVFKPADERGDILVQVQKSKMTFNRKRLSLYIPKSKLYPEGDYDMDIVFDTKENRKKRKQMHRKYVPGLQITTEPEKPRS
ncbi:MULTISPECIES: DNA mismatch repair protein MutS [unclassified Paenibacillus]|uniref:endonuclease MutS2 n=1 Tax=unclassified Paenibacillus TaxID=185978 RepID=UPI00278325B7|nr:MULTISPECIES: DNA mismatch repair protein MutS [unclassified Paenibacillus]MDQ0901312.1 DNA mismatch repair protein MutS2 [Paenibacillus sp. V4I7]MDQ0920187.1 DNA mismatch repair protein MutS2 [Paenibacillus sp. V4I5]